MEFYCNYIIFQVFFAVVPEHVPVTDHLIRMNPNTMRIIGVCIGGYMVVNNTFAALAWPDVTLPYTHIVLSSQFAHDYHLEAGSALVISSLEVPVMKAVNVCLHCRYA